MPRKGNQWLTSKKYFLRRNYHHYNLRSSPLRIRRQTAVPRRSVSRRQTNDANTVQPVTSTGSFQSSHDVAIINVDTTIHSSVSEFESPEETASEESQSISPEMMMGGAGYGRLRFPFSISQPTEAYRSPRIIDNLAAGDGPYNNIFTFHIVQMGPLNETEENDDPDFNDDYGE